MNYTRDRNLLLTVYFSFYYIIFLFYALDHRLLFQYQPIFFNYNRDLTELLLIGTGFPGYMIAHPITLLLADGLVILLPLVLLGHLIRRGSFSWGLGLGFGLFFAFYHLLSNIFWQVDHEPFMLYVFLIPAFMTNRPDRFYSVLRFCRYYFLYILVSAAIWKIARGAIFNPDEMSHILLLHHSDLLSEAGNSIQSRFYLFLIDHPALSRWLYLGAVLLELAFLTGFFTRSYDRLLIGAAVLFVAADFFVMRIPYWIILMGSVTLWIGSRRTGVRRFSRVGQRRQRGMSRSRQRGGHSLPPGLVIYETTHHENLPALLDLSAAHFEKVTVFLKELSYTNLSGRYDPTLRWPAVTFIIQEVGNRAFIGQVFRFLRKYSYSHLHLSTIDNNWLLFALRISLLRNVQVSLTVHAVNDYFSFSFRSLKGLTESIAKFWLHRLIRHYTFFLPAMADNFRRRLPGSVAVSIPSRFYTRETRRQKEGAPFRIIIPGSVDPHRRNYQEVTDFFSSWLPERVDTTIGHRPIELVILGNSNTAYGATVVPMFRKLESELFRLVTFQEYVPAKIYEEEFLGADLIWSPLNPQKTSNDKSPEVYGLSIASGLTADRQICTAPVLAPAWLELHYPFHVGLLSYSDKTGIAAVLDKLLTDPVCLTTLRTKIDAAFTAELRKENFTIAFRQLLDLTGPDEERKEGRTDTRGPVVDDSQ